MVVQVDYRKCVAFPPEIIPAGKPVDLSAGDNLVFDYAGMKNRPPFILSLWNISFSRYDGLNFRVHADGVTDVYRLDDLGAVKGLDYTEEVKVAARETLRSYIYAPSSVSSYQLRHAVRADRPNPLLKLQLGFPLEKREEELAEKYGLPKLLSTRRIGMLDPYEGLTRILTYSKVLTASGTVLRLPVPSGYRAALLDVSMYRPSSAGQATLTLERDRGGFNVFELDPYCLGGLENPLRAYRINSILINCLEEMLVELTVTSGTHKVRLVVGLGKLTVPEKIAWRLDLTPEEKKVAEEQNLYECVEAGVA